MPLIEVSTATFEKLQKWASVSRTLKESIRLLEEFITTGAEEKVANGDLFEAVEHNLGELRELLLPLDEVGRHSKSAKSKNPSAELRELRTYKSTAEKVIGFLVGTEYRVDVPFESWRDADRAEFAVHHYNPGDPAPDQQGAPGGRTTVMTHPRPGL